MIHFNILTLLAFTALIHNLVLISVIIIKKQLRTKSNAILIFLIICISIIIFCNIYYLTGLYNYFTFFIFQDLPYYFLIPAVIFFYIKSNLIKNFRFKIFDLIIIVPFLCAYIFSSKWLFVPNKFRMIGIEIYLNNYLNVPFSYFTIALIGILFIIYLSASFFTYYRYVKEIKNNFSTIELKKLSWLKHVLIIAGTAGCTAFIFLFLCAFFIKVIIGTYIIMTVNILFIYIIGYNFLLNQNIFQISITSKDSHKKYAKSVLSDDQAKYYYKKMISIMEKQKLYNDPELDLHLLSKTLSFSRSYISEILNRYGGKNFYDFVNDYRLQEVKKQLVNPQKKDISILELAYEAGFKSKATFNRIFKKETKMSPSEYRMKNNIS